MIAQPLIITANQITVNKLCPKCKNYLLTTNAEYTSFGLTLTMCCSVCDYTNLGIVIYETEETKK